MSFHNQVIYQVYPKSFYDSNSDGIGDIRGIIEKIPYLASLGVDMVWFNPFFASPQKDNGYDISDYYAIDPRMGSMEDVGQLISGLKKEGIGVMFDMVLNHVSTEHEWFQRALAGEEKYRDFFYIRPPQDDGALPTNWESKFGGPAWAPFGDSGDYYLCLYDKTQADLNWHNPALRQELYRVVNFWLNQGVSGLRFDVLNVIGKPEILADAGPSVLDKSLYTDTPQVHLWVQQMRQETFGKHREVVTVGEMSSTSIANCISYTNPARGELDMVFNFHHLKVDYADGQKWTKAAFDFAALKKLLNDWGTGMEAGGGWNALFFNNHDQPRALNRFGDPTNFRFESATMLAAVLHLNRGTPFIYQGEEIGMTDPAYTRIEDYDDVEAHNAYRALLERGLDQEEAFAIVHSKARDNSRTPMQWSAEENGGFSAGPAPAQPWLRPTNFAEINLAVEQAEGRILPFYKKLIALRKEYAVIAEGSYRPYLPEHPAVYAYIREYGKSKLLVLNNFYGSATQVELPADFLAGKVLISNYAGAELAESTVLEPYQTLAVLVD